MLLMLKPIPTESLLIEGAMMLLLLVTGSSISNMLISYDPESKSWLKPFFLLFFLLATLMTS